MVPLWGNFAGTAGSLNENVGIGITTEPEKSGLIVDTSNYPKDGLYWYIQVYNGTYTPNNVEAALKDLSNVDKNIDFVIESYHDENCWYRKYRSGWVEQGGVTSIATAQGTATVVLPVEMANTDYIPLVTIYGETGVYNYNTNGSYFTAANLTTTGFDIFVSTTNYLRRKFWRVEGQSAEKPAKIIWSDADKKQDFTVPQKGKMTAKLWVNSAETYYARINRTRNNTAEEVFTYSDDTYDDDTTFESGEHSIIYEFDVEAGDVIWLEIYGQTAGGYLMSYTPIISEQ